MFICKLGDKMVLIFGGVWLFFFFETELPYLAQAVLEFYED